MKKHPFILLELFIALALVSFFSLPLVHGHFFYQSKQKERLLNLEKERKAEALFYQIYLNLEKNHPLSSIQKAWKTLPFSLKEDFVTFDLGKLGKTKLYWHYHLYSYVDQKKPCRKLYCQICFTKDQNVKSQCLAKAKFFDASYGFILTVKEKNQKTDD